jgi:uncharacterized C2H2 Zn-finger protein
MNKKCPLCFNKANIFFQDIQTYYRCENCDGIFVDKEDYLHPEIEKKVYEQHNIDTEDVGYRNFVSPITSLVEAQHDTNHKGLDFGAGRSCIISTVLKEKEFDVKDYDIFFHDFKEFLEEKYHFISSCEVIEHFHNPKKEFQLLKDLLEENGALYLMTDLYDEREFKSWYYKNDPTHVFFYTPKTFEYIKEKYNFHSLKIEGRLVVLAL